VNPLQRQTAASLTTPPREAVDGSPIYTVSEITRAVKDTLENNIGCIWITGEISNFRRPASGHCYFTLKDDLAQINVVMWRSAAMNLKFDIEDGLAVILQGVLTVYEPRGQYQVVVRRIEPVGVGALQLAFIQLKEKLEREGLFAPERKKPLPLLPGRIALVTSATGAAVRDMLNVILRRMPKARVIVCPVLVQGDKAAADIARMIARVNQLPGVDVMIVGRGGGSIEDLWPFNEEIVARAIAASRIPVVSAIGHETDFTIADFVADVRALTPTDAAARVAPDINQLTGSLDALASRLGHALLSAVAAAKQRVAALARYFTPRRPLERIRAREQRLDDITQRLYQAIRHAIALQQQRMQSAGARLESLSPLAVLARGYSVTIRQTDGAVIRDAARLKPGDLVRTRLHRGEFHSRVLSPPESPKAAPRGPSKEVPAKKTAHKKRKHPPSRKGRAPHGA